MSRGYYTPCLYTRRQSSDIFQNDPFKTQSYKFHYAERPVYPVQHYQRAMPKQPDPPPPFKTYYYNTRFHRNQESPPTSSFVESRRRQFLQDIPRVPTVCWREMSTSRREPLQVASISPAVSSNPPLLRTCYNREAYKDMRRGQSVTAMKQSSGSPRTETKSASVSSFAWKQPARNQSQTSIKITPRRTARSSSGCAININIRAGDSQKEEDKSLRIEIETDACLHNNTDKLKVLGHVQETPKSAVKRCGSTDSFVIDKRLSKFSLKRSFEEDALLAKRLLVQLKRERVEEQHQQELKWEQERLRQRERERERLREAERQQDIQRIRELEKEREHQRLRQLERETQRKIDFDRRCAEQQRRERQQRMPMRVMSMPSSIVAPAPMTSHLYSPASTDRLPGMAPCYVHQNASKAKRLQKCTRSLAALRPQKELPKTQQSPPAQRSLERRSSGTSNFNVGVPGSGSTTNMRQVSATRLNESKLLNLHVNGVPVNSNLRINNMPIRITTSQPANEHLQFSINRVRVDKAAPMATAAQDGCHNRSRSSSRSGLQESSSMPCSVNINVYADNPSR